MVLYVISSGYYYITYIIMYTILLEAYTIINYEYKLISALSSSYNKFTHKL